MATRIPHFAHRKICPACPRFTHEWWSLTLSFWFWTRHHRVVEGGTGWTLWMKPSKENRLKYEPASTPMQLWDCQLQLGKYHWQLANITEHCYISWENITDNWLKNTSKDNDRKQYVLTVDTRKVGWKPFDFHDFHWSQKPWCALTAALFWVCHEHQKYHLFFIFRLSSLQNPCWLMLGSEVSYTILHLYIWVENKIATSRRDRTLESSFARGSYPIIDPVQQG